MWMLRSFYVLLNIVKGMKKKIVFLYNICQFLYRITISYFVILIHDILLIFFIVFILLRVFFLCDITNLN